MQRNISFSAVLLSVSVFAHVAHAGGTLTRDDRSIDILASASDLSGGEIVNPLATSPSFGIDWDFGFDSGTVFSDTAASNARAVADQVSTFDDPLAFSTVNANGSIHIEGDTDLFDISDAQASADSVFEIEFSIDSNQMYTLSGSAMDDGGRSFSRVFLRFPNGSIIYQAEDDPSFMDSGMLIPGDYELVGEASAVDFAQDGDSFDLDASYDLTFTLVPEPASGFLLLMGSAMLMRRRPMA